MLKAKLIFALTGTLLLTPCLPLSASSLQADFAPNKKLTTQSLEETNTEVNESRQARLAERLAKPLELCENNISDEAIKMLIGNQLKTQMLKMDEVKLNGDHVRMFAEVNSQDSKEDSL